MLKSLENSLIGGDTACAREVNLQRCNYYRVSIVVGDTARKLLPENARLATLLSGRVDFHEPRVLSQIDSDIVRLRFPRVKGPA